MRLYQPSLVLSFAATVIATPVPIPAPPAAECKAVQLVVSALQLAKATPFCSSFLKIPVSTSISTATSYSTFTQTTNIPEATNTVVTTTVVDEITNTLVTGTSTDYVATITDVSSTTSVSTVYSTSTVTATYGANAKRATNEVEARSIPPFLAAFASSEISSACSCLSIPTSVVKTTVTTTLPVSTTQTAFFTSTVSTGTTTKTTSTQDIESVITTTAATTTTDTIPSTTTIGVLATTYVDPTATQTFRLRCEGTGNDLYDGGHFESYATQMLVNIGVTGDIFALGAQGQLFLNSNPDQIVGSFAGSSYVRVLSASTGGFTPLTCSIANSLLSCQSNDGNGNVLDVLNSVSAAGPLQIQASVTSGYFAASIYVDPA